MRKGIKVYLNEKELRAIASMIDLAAASVHDAEFDYQESKDRPRRGGYSMDLKNAERWLSRAFKELAKPKV